MELKNCYFLEVPVYIPKIVHLETSHVLPTLIRKMHLGKCLENHDWSSIREDLKKHQIEGLSDTSNEAEIIEELAKFGIMYSNTQYPAPSQFLK